MVSVGDGLEDGSVLIGEMGNQVEALWEPCLVCQDNGEGDNWTRAFSERICLSGTSEGIKVEEVSFAPVFAHCCCPS